MTYTKYPRAWHLPDSPNRGADGDQAHEGYSTFEGREVVVTEKLDGARASRRLADQRRQHLRTALDRRRPAAVVLPAVRGLRRSRHMPELGGRRGVGRTARRRLGPTRGPFVRAKVLALLGGASAFGPEREGIVLRWADAFGLADHRRAVGKLVRRDHVKTDQHWMHGEVVANELAADA